MNKLNLIGAYNNFTSYSLATVKITQELLNLGVDLSVFPIGGNSNDKEITEIINKYHHRINTPDIHSSCLKIWHEFALWEHVSRPYYGFPIFELDTFNDNTKASLNNCNDLITCSNWGKEVLLSNTLLTEEEVHVCPLGVDTKIFKPRTIPQSDYNYIFINIGKWEYRKHSRLANIFNKAFDHKDNVELWLLPHNQFLNEKQTLEWIKYFKDSKLGYKIKIFPRQSITGLVDLMRMSDCAIYPSHSEGYGLPILEAMAMNIPVITTNYSAMTNYCTTQNSFLVSVTEKEIANDGVFFHGNGSWAKIGDKEVDQFVDYMRYCYNNHINSNSEGVKTAQSLTWRNSAQILKEIIFPPK